jgi:hypothetical protein
MVQTYMVAIVCFTIIVFIITVVVASIYIYRAVNCTKYPNYWCWTDWTCPNSAQCPAGEGGVTCWDGATSIYGRINNLCKADPSDPNGIIPPGCTCVWIGNGGEPVCRQTTI